MNYRLLGQTGLRVSALGFGAAPLGNEYHAIDPQAAKRAVDVAIERGVNYFDVAPYYGRTLAEERLGAYLKGQRDQVVLATKVGRFDKALPDGFDFSAERTVQSVEESLRRLRTDVIDVIKVHDVEFGDAEVILHETLPTLARLREQGKVRYIGITGYPLQILKALAQQVPVDVILSYCHYDLLDTTMDAVLTPFAQAKRIGLINASPMHMGMLTLRGAPDWHPAPEAVHAASRAAVAWCAERGLDLPLLAMQFALANAAVATTLVGMGEPEIVERNLAALETPTDLTAIRALRTQLAPVANVTWPSGLPENQDNAILAAGTTEAA
ncbi:MAG: aldo/keto reductase [Rhodothermales bacterium]